MEYKDIIINDKEERPQHFKFLLHKNKDINLKNILISKFLYFDDELKQLKHL